MIIVLAPISRLSSDEEVYVFTNPSPYFTISVEASALAPRIDKQTYTYDCIEESTIESSSRTLQPATW